MSLLRSSLSKVSILMVSVLTAVPILAADLTMLEMMVARAKNDPTALISLNDYGSFVQAVSGPFSLPGVASASFQVSRGALLGEGDFTRVALPLSRSFKKLKFGGITPYAEMTLSYTNQKQNEFWMEGTTMQMMVSHDIKTTSVLSGLGAGFEPVKGGVIRPIILLGWTRIKDNSDPTTTMGRMFQAEVGNNLFDWNVEQLQFGLAIETEYKTKIGKDVNVLSGIRATQLRIKTHSTSTPGLEASNNFTSISGNIEFDGPTSLSLFGRDVRWQTFAGATSFDKDTGRALSFNWLGETGAGIVLMNRKQNIPFVEGLGLRGSLILGDGIKGLAVGISAIF